MKSTENCTRLYRGKNRMKGGRGNISIVIYTDPPWQQTKGNIRKCRPNQERALDYSTLGMDEIFEIHKKFFDQCEDKHNVFMWTIDKFLHETEQRMKNLGYTLHARL